MDCTDIEKQLLKQLGWQPLLLVDIYVIEANTTEIGLEDSYIMSFAEM